MSGQGRRRHRHTVGRECGFTLVEILVVIIVIGLLAGIAVPVFLNQQGKSKAAATRANERNLVTEIVLARENTGLFLKDLTGNACSDCPCRPLDPLPKVTDPGFLGTDCGQNWSAAANKIAAATGSPPETVRALMTDGWGRPILWDENEGETSQGGCAAGESMGSAGTGTLIRGLASIRTAIPNTGWCG